MKKKVCIIFQMTVLVFSTSAFSFAASSVTMVNQGNKLYRQKKYDDALQLYHQAQIKDPDSSLIEYNIGVAQFKKGEYASAISSFEKATSSKEKILEAKANYNIGNSKYKLGALKKNTDINQAVKLYRESLDYYKRAIDLDPKDTNAKINHELVEKELKILLDQAKQEQEKKDQLQGQGQDKTGRQEKQEEQKAGQSSGQAQGPAPTEKQQGDAPREKQGKDGQAEEKQKEASESGKDSTQEEAKEMSVQEAKMLLEGARQDESAPGKIDDSRQGYEADVLKDW